MDIFPFKIGVISLRYKTYRIIIMEGDGWMVIMEGDGWMDVGRQCCLEL